MTKINAEETKQDLRKEESDNANATEKHSQEEQKESAQQNNEDKSDQETATIEREENASTTNTAAEYELVPVRHPRLSNTPPRFFVSKDGVVCSNARGSLRPLKMITKGPGVCTFRFQTDYEYRSFKLDEIMAYTFSDHFDRHKHYVFHKDGDRYNCAWNNLIICDLATLQQMEIDRLERLYPGTKYTVVRDVHDTMTFERYLVSDSGCIYSLARREHPWLSESVQGYLQFYLSCDTDDEQASVRGVTIPVHSIVMQSFNGRRPRSLYIIHLNGDKQDNTLKNLAYAGPTAKSHPARKKRQTTAKKQGYEFSQLALPPVTDETRWKTIGVLPWNGLSFSRYEVSDMGHVRNKDSSQLLKLSYSKEGYAVVYMFHDNQHLKTHPKTVLVPRLVANAFVDGYSEVKNIVKHLNDDRRDNCAQNLKWISPQNSSKMKTACPVIASLVDDPKVQKTFPSINKAQIELSAYGFSRTISTYSNPFERKVNWDGEEKMALIQVLPSRQDEE